MNLISPWLQGIQRNALMRAYDGNRMAIRNVFKVGTVLDEAFWRYFPEIINSSFNLVKHGSE